MNLEGLQEMKLFFGRYVTQAFLPVTLEEHCFCKGVGYIFPTT